MLLILWAAASVIYGAVLDSYTTYREYQSPAEQLQTALTFCPLNANGEVTCAEPEMNVALGHLDKIMPDAQEHAEAERLRTAIQALRKKNDDAHAAVLVQQKADSPDKFFNTRGKEVENDTVFLDVKEIK